MKTLGQMLSPQGGGWLPLHVRRYGDVPFFRGNLFLKSAELSISLFEICAELWVPFEETYSIMGTILGKHCNTIKGGRFSIEIKV